MRFSVDIFLAFLVAVLLQGFLSYQAGTFTPSQMARTYPGHRLSFSLASNGGWWGDIFIIPVLMALYYGAAADCSPVEKLLALLLGTIGSWAIHKYLYAQGEYMDAMANRHTGINGLVGWLHVAIFAVGLGLMLLFYYRAIRYGDVPEKTVILVGILFGLHIIVANHIPLGIIQKWKQFNWCPPIFGKMDQIGKIAGASVAFMILTYFAASGSAAIIFIAVYLPIAAGLLALMFWI